MAESTQRKNLTSKEMLEVIFESVGKIANETRLDNALLLLNDLAREILVADRSTVWLLDKETDELWAKVAHGMDEIRIPKHAGLVGWAVANDEPVFIKDAYKDERFNQTIDKKTGYRTKSILVQLMKDNDGEIFGAFQAINKMTKSQVFSKKDLEHLTLVSSYAAKSLESAFLLKEIIDTQKDVIFSMAEIGESRSKETGNHVKRVAEYSKLLAIKYGLSEEEADILKMASPMHDIGKVGIPDSVLKKPGRLTVEEFEIMKTHSALGYDILKNSKRQILKAASIVAGQHHEKFNGKGYPNGLKGEEIHIYGRITAVADVFDALSSDRVYKRAWPLENVLNLFREERGEHFEAKLVDILLDNVDEFIKIKEEYEDTFSDEEIAKELEERAKAQEAMKV